MLSAILESIGNSRQTVIDLQRTLVSIPAVGPDNGGQGEDEKCRAMLDWLAANGVSDVTVYKAPDSRVASGARPSVKAVIPGLDTSRTFWVISHLDVVPPGDVSLWTTDPFELVVDGDALIGRGVEDNHQGVVASLLVAKALAENESKINAELIAAQGAPVDMGGYYHPDFDKTSKAMRPSATLNQALAAI